MLDIVRCHAALRVCFAQIGNLIGMLQMLDDQLASSRTASQVYVLLSMYARSSMLWIMTL